MEIIVIFMIGMAACAVVGFFFLYDQIKGLRSQLDRRLKSQIETNNNLIKALQSQDKVNDRHEQCIKGLLERTSK